MISTSGHAGGYIIKNLERCRTEFLTAFAEMPFFEKLEISFCHFSLSLSLFNFDRANFFSAEIRQLELPELPKYKYLAEKIFRPGCLKTTTLTARLHNNRFEQKTTTFNSPICLKTALKKTYL